MSEASLGLIRFIAQYYKLELNDAHTRTYTCTTHINCSSIDKGWGWGDSDPQTPHFRSALSLITIGLDVKTNAAAPI